MLSKIIQGFREYEHRVVLKITVLVHKVLNLSQKTARDQDVVSPPKYRVGSTKGSLWLEF